MIQLRTPFIAHFDLWKGGEVLLILVDDEITQWLMARFEQLTDSARRLLLEMASCRIGRALCAYRAVEWKREL